MMGTNSEATWQAVGDIWCTGETRALPLAEQVALRVHRQSRRLRMILFGEIALTVVMLAMAFAILQRSSTTVALRGGAIVLIYTAAVWTFGLWNRRGIWRPLGHTTVEFVHLLRMRAQRRIQSARFTQIVVGLASVFVGRDAVASWSSGTSSRWDSAAGLIFAVYVVAMIVWSIWYEIRARREIRDLAGYERQLNQEVVRVAE